MSLRLRESIILFDYSTFPSMIELLNLQIGSMMKDAKVLFNYFPVPEVFSDLQHLPSASK